MKLTNVRVRNFRNILDSGDVAIQSDVTCLVGKNESGKTAFLQALDRLRPATIDPGFNVLFQYPAWLEKEHRRQGIELEKTSPIEATFQLESSEKEKVADLFGAVALQEPTLLLSRQYDGSRAYTFKINERAIISTIVEKAGLVERLSEKARTATDLVTLQQLIASLKSEPDEVATTAAVALESELAKRLAGKPGFDDAIYDLLEPYIPKFFYSGNYDSLPGEIKIRRALQVPESELTPNERIARSLLHLAAATNDYLIAPDYERRRRELENVSNGITADVLRYWTQNKRLRVSIDITKEVEQSPDGRQTTVLDELKIRIYDDAHWLSLPFPEHSTGFQWFFSFLAAFSRYERDRSPVVILLDEPGLGLHGRAQKDFLRFIDDRLSVGHQVIYTTHSPFMVQPDKLERARIVEDQGIDIGSVVSQDILTTDPDTLFPLVGALGYDLAQHLLIGPNNLIVEGTADFTYLTVLSDFLKGQSRTGLDDKWNVVPVGGADLIPTFVALLGNKLDVTVLVDGRTEQHQKLARLAQEGYLARQRIVALGEEFANPRSNIEDVFATEDYLMLFNESFGTAVSAADLPGTDSVVDRLTRWRGASFVHGKPADTLLRHRDVLLPRLGTDTSNRFEQLFTRINGTLLSPD